jgi:hypothetical protein
MDQKTGGAAVASIVAAGLCYVAICMGHPWWGLVAAIVSLPLGLAGFLWSASSKVSGGILSIFAIGLGLVGIVLSILVGVGKIFV